MTEYNMTVTTANMEVAASAKSKSPAKSSSETVLFNFEGTEKNRTSDKNPVRIMTTKTTVNGKTAYIHRAESSGVVEDKDGNRFIALYSFYLANDNNQRYTNPDTVAEKTGLKSQEKNGKKEYYLYETRHSFGGLTKQYKVYYEWNDARHCFNRCNREEFVGQGINIGGINV